MDLKRNNVAIRSKEKRTYRKVASTLLLFPANIVKRDVGIHFAYVTTICPGPKLQEMGDGNANTESTEYVPKTTAPVRL